MSVAPPLTSPEETESIQRCDGELISGLSLTLRWHHKISLFISAFAFVFASLCVAQ